MLIEALRPLLGSFDDQVVLVTGASSGIGRETALGFARRGARVALAARRRGPLEEVAEEIGGGEALVVPIDVTDHDSVRAGVGTVRRKWGRVDILVNNAGILRPAPVEKLRREDLDAMWRINVIGALSMMQAVLPLMKRRKRGTIINVASLAGRRGITPLGGYCATKFALVGLTEALRTEVNDSIHVGLVMPGVIDTPMVDQVNRSEDMPIWPSAFNMPPDWVVAAIMLAVRFHLREISVPPGSATLELIGALAPSATDALIGWANRASRMLARRGKTGKRRR